MSNHTILPEVLHPDADTSSPVERPVNQTMHFTRSETFPPEGPASLITTTQTVSTTKPARPQPEGLRARFTPVGVPSPKPTITPVNPPKAKAVASSAAQDSSIDSTPKAGSSKKKRKHRDDGEDGPAATLISTPVFQKDAPSSSAAVPSGGTKKNTPAEKSAKKQKTGNRAAPRKETPVPVPSIGYSSGSGSRSNSFVGGVSASQPVARSRSSLSPGATLPATQVPVPFYSRPSMSPGAPLHATHAPLPVSAKQTPVPIPRAGGPSSVTSSSSRPPADAAAGVDEKQLKKERKKAAKDSVKVEKAVATKDRKVSQVPVPRFVGGKPVFS